MSCLRLGILATGALCAVVGCVTLCAAAQAGVPESPAAAQVRALEYKWADAEKRKDIFALDAFIDNALVFVDYDGNFLSKAAYLTKIRVAQAGVLEIAIESMNVHAFGTTVVVIGIYHEKGMDGGKLYLRRRRFLNTWAFKNGSWVCIAAAAMPLQR